MWPPLHHFAIFNSFILTRVLSAIFCIMPDTVLKRRFIAMENDRNVVPFPYLLPHVLNSVLIHVWWGFHLSHGRDKVGRRVDGNWICSERWRAQSCPVFCYFLLQYSGLARTKEFTEYLTAIICSSSMAFIIQKAWLQNEHCFFLLGYHFVFCRRLLKKDLHVLTLIICFP